MYCQYTHAKQDKRTTDLLYSVTCSQRQQGSHVFLKKMSIVSIKMELSAEMMFFVVVRDRGVMNILDLNEGLNECL